MFIFSIASIKQPIEDVPFPAITICDSDSQRPEEYVRLICPLSAQFPCNSFTSDCFVFHIRDRSKLYTTTSNSGNRPNKTYSASRPDFYLRRRSFLPVSAFLFTTVGCWINPWSGALTKTGANSQAHVFHTQGRPNRRRHTHGGPHTHG